LSHRIIAHPCREPYTALREPRIEALLFAIVAETEVRSLVKAFLRERGLTLSPEKTKITHDSECFDFLRSACVQM
jgi:hypothetical protein